MTNKDSPHIGFAARLMLLFIRGYQRTFSSFMGRSCRFHPTCSSYGHQAITEYGAVKGVFLTIARILRCHPFNPGGYDPVPENHRFFSNKTFWGDVTKCDKQSHTQEHIDKS